MVLKEGKEESLDSQVAHSGSGGWVDAVKSHSVADVVKPVRCRT